MARTAAHGGLWARAWRRLRLGFGLTGAALVLASCASSTINQFTTTTPPPQLAEQPAPPPGNGQVRVALILPLLAQGNAGVAAQSMKNAAEMALAEFKQPTCSCW